VERQGSGGLAFIIVETEEGRLAGLGPGRRGGRAARAGEEGHASVEGEGDWMWSGCTAMRA
jgi:hypothetical protein